MTRGPVAIHAAKGMTRDEYEEARAFIMPLVGDCPRPDELRRGAIIGQVTVIAIVSQHRSPWFFGPRGLVLRDPEPVEPIPAKGQLGYFRWQPSGWGPQRFAPVVPLPWMRAWRP